MLCPTTTQLLKMEVAVAQGSVFRLHAESRCEHKPLIRVGVVHQTFASQHERGQKEAVRGGSGTAR